MVSSKLLCLAHMMYGSLYQMSQVQDLALSRYDNNKYSALQLMNASCLIFKEDSEDFAHGKQLFLKKA